jgi:DNA-binding PadR family transcriptional regulator
MKAELLILGVLHRGKFHPYEIKRRLEKAMVECYTDVDTGTLYYAIRQLAKDGMIATVARERVERGGMRTVYGISAAGRRRFQDLLHAQFEAEGSVADTLYGAMLFLHLCDLPSVAELVAKKIARQTEAIQKIALVRKALAPLLSTGGHHLIKHIDQQRRLDRRWLQGLHADIIAGRVRDVSTRAKRMLSNTPKAKRR